MMLMTMPIMIPDGKSIMYKGKSNYIRYDLNFN